MAPMMVMTNETTAAKIGRSMKNWLIRMRLPRSSPVPSPHSSWGEGWGEGQPFAPAPLAAPLPIVRSMERGRSFPLLLRRAASRRFRHRQRLALGRHLLAGPGALQAPRDHPLVARQPFARHAQAVEQGPGDDALARDGAVLADGKDILVCLVGAD